jgi:hypothetical protein
MEDEKGGLGVRNYEKKRLTTSFYRPFLIYRAKAAIEKPMSVSDIAIHDWTNIFSLQ